MNAPPWPRLALAHCTDPGRDPNKQENEDSLAYHELALGHLLLVCDGMGGHAAGREASQLAVSTIAGELARAPAGAHPGEALRAAIEVANRRVYEMGGASSGSGRPGSTCVAVLIHPMGTEVAHLGDSRAYLFRAGQIWPLTRDHSMVQQMVDAGVLRAEDAHSHPDSNMITRALGMDAQAQVELKPDPVLQQPGDIFLLVSDGVSDVVRETDLQAIATLAGDATQLDRLCQQVVQLANARGGPDNTTILAAWVNEAGLRPGAGMPRAPAPTIIDEELPRNRPTNTLPGGIPAAPAPPPAAPLAAPLATPIPAAPRPPGAGATVKLIVHAPPGMSDDATVDHVPVSRTRRVVMGVLLALVGLLVAALSGMALFAEDEAPPPLVDAPPGSTSAR